MTSYNEIIDYINDAQMVLVGLGDKIHDKEIFNKLADILQDKDYYIVSMNEENDIFNSKLDEAKIVAPFSDVTKEEDWNEYLKWLSMTLNKSLIVLELEVSFNKPEVIRFPFEKTVLYNKKARMYRVNSVFYQIPEEISDKAEGIKIDVFDFLNEL